jgi:hypothetical protein
MPAHKHEFEYLYMGTAQTADYDQECVARILKKKAEAGHEIDDKAKAIAISECRNDRNAQTFNLIQPELIDGKYAKYWLLKADTVNGNGWSVGKKNIEQNIKTAIGMPFVVTAKSWFPNSDYGTDVYEHPDPRRSKDMRIASNWRDPQTFISYQSQYTAGEITETLKQNDDYYAMVKIAEQFRNKRLPPYCSPAIYAPGEPAIGAEHWHFMHLAGLAERPAYGIYVAMLKGACVGTAHQCETQFRSAQQIDFKCQMGKITLTQIELLNAKLKLQK